MHHPGWLLGRAAACLWLLTTAPAWSASFSFANPPGPYAVGLRVVRQYDDSRSYRDGLDIVSGQVVDGPRARPMQTLVWYPAASGGRPLHYADYVALAATEESLDPARQGPGALDRHADALQALAHETMQASLDRPPVDRKFPVVIYAPSFGASAMENADLCEYLASQGYVVIASASMGARSRAMTGDLEGIETQVGDVEYLIAYAHSLAQVDFDRIAVVGFSWGGLANVAAAARDFRIRAFVSLDGTVRYDNDMVKAIGYLSPARIEVPYLYVASRPATLEQMNVDKKYYDISKDFLNELKYSDVYIATMNAMRHEDFSSYFLRVLPDDSDDAGYTRQEASVAHAWVARYVERFLTAYLKHDAAARAFLGNAPERNGVPRHFMRVDARPREAPAPTLENIAAELARHGFDQADALIREMRLDDADAKPAEGALDDWAHRALYAGNAPRAVQLFQFALRLYPASAALYAGLGQAWQAGGNGAQAAASFRRALALDPHNSVATRELRALNEP